MAGSSPPRWSRWIPRLVLAAFAAAGGLWLANLDYAQKISTDVVDLLPNHEREPEVQLLRSLVSETQARSLWFVLTDEAGAPPRDEAVAAFVAQLQSDPGVAAAERVDDGTTQRELAAHIFENRFRLLLPQWLQAQRLRFAATGEPLARFSDWLAQSVVDRLDQFLTRSESAAFEELLPADPLLLMPDVAEQAALLGGAGASSTASAALVWASSVASPLAEAGQLPVFAAVEAAGAAAQAVQPGLQVEWSGVHRFAAASKARIRAEVSWLNTASVLMVLAVTGLLVRRPWRVLHLLPVVLLALLGAWATTTLLFERIHILVFVLGALLTGAAIDYGFHVSVHLDDHPGKAGFARLRPVLKPLLGSCLTTVIGFSLLFFSELPLLRQLGVFVTAGLLSALAAALLYFSQLSQPSIQPRRGAGLVRRPPWLLTAAAVLGLGAAAGLLRLHWHDDIRELEVPAEALQENDQQVRAHFGDDAERSAYLIRGPDLAETRTRLAEFSLWHEQHYGEPPASVGAVLPTEEQHRQTPETLPWLRSFPAALQGALEARGYASDEFQPFFDGWGAYVAEPRVPYRALLAGVVERLHGPWSNLGGANERQAWLLAFSPHAATATPPTALGVVELNQLRTLNRVFTRYRTHALELSVAGVLLVVGAVLLLYGPARAVRVLLVPVGACVVTFGALGWLGHPLNLFHLLGAFLGLCLSHDYAIFASEPRPAGEPAPASIRLAALTTAASFGALMFSQIPVISSLGVTVTLIVLVALVMVESIPLRRRPS